MIMFPKKLNHKHREAYCLMKYASRKQHPLTGNFEVNEELIWNSRDGVTPFLINSEYGQEMVHVKWTEDEYKPHHTLEKGDRYFADMSRDRAMFLAKDWVARHGNWDNYTKDETAFMLAKEYYGDGHLPTILKFGESAIEYIPRWQKEKK